MKIEIRPLCLTDRPVVLKMMRAFYASPAVLSNGSEEIFQKDIDACLSDNAFLEGYAFVDGKSVLGYAMIAKSFSTEFGKPCVWIEDLYILESCRSMGIGALFLQYLKERFSGCLLKLEVEEENTGAMRFYQKHGFHVLPYTEMILNTK